MNVTIDELKAKMIYMSEEMVDKTRMDGLDMIPPKVFTDLASLTKMTVE